MNNIVKAFEEATELRCFETYRRCLDSERINQIEYDSFDRVFMNQPAEFRYCVFFVSGHCSFSIYEKR